MDLVKTRQYFWISRDRLKKSSCWAKAFCYLLTNSCTQVVHHHIVCSTNSPMHKMDRAPADARSSETRSKQRFEQPGGGRGWFLKICPGELPADATAAQK